MTTIRIHSYLTHSLVEGPYTRFVIWLQGCSIRCPGCANKHMWDFNGGQEILVDELLNIIMDQVGIEGITLVGGEPFDQAQPLKGLVSGIKKCGLGVVTFTGYTYEYLSRSKSCSIHYLMNHTDLLIDGPFQQKYQTLNMPWVGSRNQRLIHLSERYRGFDFATVQNKYEIRLNKDHSKIIFNGIGDNKAMNNFWDSMRKRGFMRKD